MSSEAYTYQKLPSKCSKLSSWFFHSIARAWELAGEQSSKNGGDNPPDESEEERNERQFSLENSSQTIEKILRT